LIPLLGAFLLRNLFGEYSGALSVIIRTKCLDQSYFLIIFWNIGFKYIKFNDEKKFAMEKMDIMVILVGFLRAVHNNCSSGDHPIYYLGESWKRKENNSVQCCI
jgi:hypothetical protein